jgi:hypothetical protein
MDRHGIVPDTDDADIYVGAAATCFARIARESGKLPRLDAIAWWCEKWAPHFTEADQAEILDKAINNFWILRTDDDWGRLLRLSDADRTRLQIRTIGSYDVDRNARVKRCRAKKRERNRLRDAEKRRAKGAVPRDQYLAASLSKAKPWESMGISRRTFERRRKAAATIDASPSPHPSYLSVSGALASRSAESPTTDGIRLTTPPACAVGTPSNQVLLVRVDCAAIVGDHSRQMKTRFKTSMRLTKELRQYALDAMFEPAKVDDMFESFGLWNIAKGSYSNDWNEVWINWVDREVDIANEANTKAWRAQAREYWENRP